MKYFNTLPTIINVNDNGSAQVLKNLVVRNKLIDTLSNNPLVFYKYTVQEGDSPEIVAYKYYGDQYRYWMVLLSNESLDPLWSWPLTSTMFSNYMTDKYSEAANTQNVLEYTQTNIHHYEKLITTPHVMQDMYPNTPETINNAYKIIKKNWKEKNPLPLQFGAEYLLDDSVQKLVDLKKEILPIKQKKILIEFLCLSAQF